MFLKVSPWKEKIQFENKGKLSLRFIEPFEELKRIGEVAYKVALPPESGHIHNVFHVSVLRPYKLDHKHVIQDEPIQTEKDLTYEEAHVQIVDRKERVLRNKIISLVKVIWRNHSVDEATWKLEKKMKKSYLHLFQ